MGTERAAAMVEVQADGCAKLGSPLYAALLTWAAADIRAGGPCAAAIAGYEDAPGPDAIALRLLGGVHALVLTGRPASLRVAGPDRPCRVGDRHPFQFAVRLGAAPETVLAEARPHGIPARALT
jgi:hypothetical protein